MSNVIRHPVLTHHRRMRPNMLESINYVMRVAQKKVQVVSRFLYNAFARKWENTGAEPRL